LSESVNAGVEALNNRTNREKKLSREFKKG